VPTFERSSRFDRDFKKLTPANADRFVEVITNEFVPALRNGPPYPDRLRIKRVVATEADWEMSWDSDGRATFQFGEPLVAGHVHVAWLRVGDHGVLP